MEPAYLSINRKMDSENVVHIQMEFSVTKENEIMIFARIIVLDKINQIQKNAAHFIVQNLDL